MNICFFRHYIFLFLNRPHQICFKESFICHSLFLPVWMFSCLQAAFRWTTAMNAPLWPSSWPNADQVFSVTMKTLWHCCWKSLQMAQMDRVINNAVVHLANRALSNVFYYSQSHATTMNTWLHLQREVAVKRALGSWWTSVFSVSRLLSTATMKAKSHHNAQTIEILAVALLTGACKVPCLWNTAYPEHC